MKTQRRIVSILLTIIIATVITGCRNNNGALTSKDATPSRVVHSTTAEVTTESKTEITTEAETIAETTIKETIEVTEATETRETTTENTEPYNNESYNYTFTTTTSITEPDESYDNVPETPTMSESVDDEIDSENENSETDKISTDYEVDSETYIIVDISTQTLKYYNDGELILSSPVVTGNEYSSPTPIGRYEIISKYKDIILTGDDYESPVEFWLGFFGSGYGLHDASWRTEFGSDIYTYNGSHGCINVPLSNMEELYYLIEIGTPVIIQ